MPGEGGARGGRRSSFLFKTNESGTKAAVVNPKTAKSLFENKRNKKTKIKAVKRLDTTNQSGALSKSRV